MLPGRGFDRRSDDESDLFFDTQEIKASSASTDNHFIQRHTMPGAIVTFSSYLKENKNGISPIAAILICC